MNNENILLEANKLVNGDRQKAYSDPDVNMDHIARVSSELLNKKMTASEIAIIMIVTKLCRETYVHKRDNLVDIAGYAWVLSRVKGED